MDTPIEPTITCPHCKTPIKLTESLAAPLIEATRREYETRIAAKDAAVAARESMIREREEAVVAAQAAMETQLEGRIQEERKRIAEEEAQKARRVLDADLEERGRTITELEGVIRQRDEKLAEAQKAQAELARERRALEDAQRELELTVEERLREGREKIAAEAEKRVRQGMEERFAEGAREKASLEEMLKERDAKLAEAQKVQAEALRKQRELDDAFRELELKVEKGVQDGLTQAREQARREAEESLNLKLMESQQTIGAMQRQIEELKRKAEQGSQQLQGEVQELELEALLGARFPIDTITPVPKGEFGGDVIQQVNGPLAQSCGAILWESKRTKNWSDGWLVKLREDQRSAKAEIAVLVSQALPKGIESFELIDGIWVTHPRTAIPVALCLRQSLIEVALARQAGEGQKTKAEYVYQYLIGPRFRQRVEAIVEAFTSMKEDLDKEKKVLQKQWAKREMQIENVIQATVGMYGDLQGIAGKTLQELDGLPLLTADEEDEG